MWGIYQVRRSTAAFVATVLCAGLLVQVAVAQTITNPAPPAQTITHTQKTVTDPTTGNTVKQTTDTTTYGNTTWQGLNWGIGIAADFDLGGKRVTGAEIDNIANDGSIVRVTDTSGNVGVSFVLEAHYFFAEWPPYLGCLGLNCTDLATGPFVAIEVGNGATASPDATGLITGYALGWMVGMHHPWAATPDSKLTNSSWNFGLGLRVDPSAEVLGDGVLANHPPPPGVTTTAQLFKHEPRYGLMLLSSFSF